MGTHTPTPSNGCGNWGSERGIGCLSLHSEQGSRIFPPSLSLDGWKVEVLKGASRLRPGADRMLFLPRQASCQEHASVPMGGHHQGQKARWGWSSAHGHQRRPEGASALGRPRWRGALGHLQRGHTDCGGGLPPHCTQSR